MFQLDDTFLQAVGLNDLPEDQKKAFLQHIYDELELRVGTKLSEGLSDSQLKEFENFMNGDEEVITRWLNDNLPGYAESEDFAKFKATMPAETPQVGVLAEYASLKWLELNRPNYKDVVAEELEALKQEIIKSRDVILGSN